MNLAEALLQAATGERPLILVGDGAFQMTGFVARSDSPL